MASGGEPSESLNIKVWVLKLSVHCEGCKKKIHKILKNIQGVIDIDIDASQNKVTVKAIVDADILIRRLEKHGKHAELWPDNKLANQNPNNSNNRSQSGSKESSKPNEKSENSEKKPAPQADGSASTTSAAVAKPADGNKAEVESKPSKANAPEANKETQISKEKRDGALTAPEEQAAAAAETATTNSHEKAADGGKGNGNGGGGAGSGNKGKKAQKESNEDALTNNSDVAVGDASPPIQHMYSYPPAYPPQQAYVMSYNMAHPSVSQAYYALPMPPAPQHGYMYQPYTYPPPPEYYYGPSDGSSSSQPQHYDSLSMFSEENPNACNLM